MKNALKIVAKETAPLMVARNANGSEFAVVLVRKGERYGRTGSLVARRDIVEFYDRKFAGDPRFDVHGQKCGEYFAETLLKRSPGVALAIDLGIPAWTIDGAAMDCVVATLRAAVSQ